MNDRTDSTGVVLQGAMTAVITPFDEAGRVDRERLEQIVRWQVDCGIHGLVPCGTTGEGATLDHDERFQVIESVVRAARKRVPVVAGCGSNDTRQTVRSAIAAAEAGADALLVVTPYYNKPNRSGMRAHYESVATATELPIVVYNVPGRTGQDLGADGVLDLAQLAGVVAVKEASGNLEQISRILERRPAGFAVLSGDDALVLPTIALGAEGVISVVANEAPGEMANLVDAARRGDLETAREFHYRLSPLMRANFVESNPVPVKTAMHLLGHCRGDLRAPLGPPESATRQIVEQALAAAGLAVERS